MSIPVIFRDLPATFPERDKYKKPSFAGSVVFHGVLIFAVLIFPLLIPQTIPERELFLTLVSPIGPPPPPPPPIQVAMIAAPKAVQPKARPVTPDELVEPIFIPKEVAKIVEGPVSLPGGVVGGAPGGIPAGVAGGVLAGILSATAADAPALAPPPAPPPPPPPPKAAPTTEPVRVGGMVKEPKLVRMLPPIYPPLASRARVSGTVVLEATLTAQGTVEEIRLVNGHPLLVQAAIDCVKQWQYEPTYLNGVPVPIILTAKVHFLRAPIS